MHILIAGEPGAGKSTLIRRLVETQQKPVCGFITKKEPADGAGEAVYLYPAAGPYRRGEENRVGACGPAGGAGDPAAFDRHAYLLENPPKGSIVVMDELGVMENEAFAFCRAVLAVLDGDGFALCAVKTRDTPFLRAVRGHPKALCFTITPENREELFNELRGLLEGGKVR